MALKKRGENKYKFDLNSNHLDLMLAYCYSGNENITMRGIMNLKNFVDMVDEKQYENDYGMNLRIIMLKFTLDAVVSNGIREYELIRGHVENNLTDQNMKSDMDIILESIEEFGELSNSDIQFINDYVSDRLTNLYLYKYEAPLNECLERLKTGNVSIKELNERFDTLITELYTNIKHARSTKSNMGSSDFSFRNERSFTEVTNRTIKQLNKPSNFIKTGIKELNNMLGGGWESGRCYVLLGLPKRFKSGSLLNAAIWGAKYNKDVVTKDPTKKPAVVYISMENSSEETLERIFHYASGESIKKYTTRQAQDLILEELTIEGSETDLVIWYRPNRSISTMDLDALLDDLAIEGLECIMLVQDYIARIKPSEYTGDTRIDYGTVVNDFTVCAKSRNIPVLTAGQLNREALRKLENGIDNNNSDLAKKIGSAEVGESQLIINNCDMAIVVNKEASATLNKNFLTFKCVACRYKDVEKPYFAHPFVDGNGMRLEEDLRMTKSMSTATISEKLNKFDPNINQSVNPRFGGKSQSVSAQMSKRNLGQDVDALNPNDDDFANI